MRDNQDFRRWIQAWMHTLKQIYPYFRSTTYIVELPNPNANDLMDESVCWLKMQ